MTASFHSAEPGPSHQAAMRARSTPDEAIDQLRAWSQVAPAQQQRLLAHRLQQGALEVVPVDPAGLFGTEPRNAAAAMWLRLRSPIAGSPALHHALLAYASDIMLLRAALLPHGFRPFTPGAAVASLDHVLWLHETPDMNDWLLFETDSPWSGHTRGLSRGHFFTAGGRMIATVSQESLMRPAPADARPV